MGLDGTRTGSRTGPPASPPEPTTPTTPAALPGAAHPAHQRASLALLVLAGGAVGSLGRYGLALALPPQHGWPVGTLVANLVGAFLLGVLLEVIGRRGPETPAATRVRLTLGTGVLGGFTTFSSLALETERLLAQGGAAIGTAFAYAGASLVGGVLAAVAGVALGGVLAGRRGGAA